MEKFTKVFIALFLFLNYSLSVFSQDVRPLGEVTDLGKCESLLQTIHKLSFSTQRNTGESLDLKVSNNKSFKGKINSKKSLSASEEYLIGSLENIEEGSFFLKVSKTSIEGNILLKKTKQAYKYYSDKNGNAFVAEVDINTVLCINYDKDAATTGENKRTAATTATAALDLQSYPGAAGVVLLDFDGQYVSGTPWNNGNPINAAPSGMSDAAIQETWELVAEDFRPFNINITTNESVFNSYPKTKRMRCIITPTNTAAPGAGGVAYLGSFAWNDDTPCWVFMMSPKSSGEAASHEVGHTFGLNHDGRTSPSEGYFQGHGSWAPIMGVGYYRAVSQWSKGEYNYANNKEDDLAKITSTTYGVGYRTDDHGNSTSSPSALVIGSTGTVSASQNRGVIERTGDLDFFTFSTGGGTVSLNFNPATRHADLDILVRLYNSAGTVIGTYNPSGLAASFSTSLASGKYFLSVDGTGAGNPATDGYSDYASLGFYSISGTIPVGGGTGNQPPVVSITSPTSGTSYNAPATVTINANASDANGTIAKVEFYNGTTKLGEDLTSPYSFTWSNVAAGSYSLTARATDNAGAATTSTVVSISVKQATTCGIPTSLSASGITASSANVKWAAQSAASSYLIWWREAGTSWSANKTVTTAYTTLTGLKSATKYEFAVSANCGGTNTGYGYSSFTTTTAATTVARVYADCNYVGTSAGLVVGTYTMSQLGALGIGNDVISSIRVTAGYEVVVYKDDNFTGTAWILRSDYSCFTGFNFNDQTTSLRVRLSTAATALQTTSMDVSTDGSVILSPNPVVDQMTVTLTNSQYADLEILDAFNKTLIVVKGATSGQTINLSGLNSGVYLVKITTGKNVVLTRVVKE